YLFQDLFRWAGQLREVDISKGETRFCTAPRIEIEGEKLFKLIPALSQIDEQEKLIEEVASLFCEINLLHPFREGNGRVQRFFFEEMLFVLGYDLTWPELTKEQWVEANIAGVYLDLEPLKTIFRRAITKL
ncbi:cell filamentation protein Fic, partial [Vibrio xuii]